MEKERSRSCLATERQEVMVQVTKTGNRTTIYRAGADRSCTLVLQVCVLDVKRGRSSNPLPTDRDDKLVQ